MDMEPDDEASANTDSITKSRTKPSTEQMQMTPFFTIHFTLAFTALHFILDLNFKCIIIIFSIPPRLLFPQLIKLKLHFICASLGDCASVFKRISGTRLRRANKLKVIVFRVL